MGSDGEGLRAVLLNWQNIVGLPVAFVCAIILLVGCVHLWDCFIFPSVALLSDRHTSSSNTRVSLHAIPLGFAGALPLILFQAIGLCSSSTDAYFLACGQTMGTLVLTLGPWKWVMQRLFAITAIRQKTDLEAPHHVLQDRSSRRLRLAQAAAIAAGTVFYLSSFGFATHRAVLPLAITCITWLLCLVCFVSIFGAEASALSTGFLSAHGVELSSSSSPRTSNDRAGRLGSPTVGDSGPASSYTFLTLVDTQVDDQGDFTKRPSIRVNYDKATKSYVQEEVDEHADWKRSTGRSLPGEADGAQGNPVCQDDADSGDGGEGRSRSGSGGGGLVRNRSGSGSARSGATPPLSSPSSSSSSSLTSSLMEDGADEPLSTSGTGGRVRAKERADTEGGASPHHGMMMAEYLVRHEGPALKVWRRKRVERWTMLARARLCASCCDGDDDIDGDLDDGSMFLDCLEFFCAAFAALLAFALPPPDPRRFHRSSAILQPLAGPAVLLGLALRAFGVSPLPSDGLGGGSKALLVIGVSLCALGGLVVSCIVAARTRDCRPLETPARVAVAVWSLVVSLALAAGLASGALAALAAVAQMLGVAPLVLGVVVAAPLTSLLAALDDAAAVSVGMLSPHHATGMQGLSYTSLGVMGASLPHALSLVLLSANSGSLGRLAGEATSGEWVTLACLGASVVLLALVEAAAAWKAPDLA